MAFQMKYKSLLKWLLPIKDGNTIQYMSFPEIAQLA